MYFLEFHNPLLQAFGHFQTGNNAASAFFCPFNLKPGVIGYQYQP
jgi:hypothetical protein